MRVERELVNIEQLRPVLQVCIDKVSLQTIHPPFNFDPPTTFLVRARGSSGFVRRKEPDISFRRLLPT